MKRVSGLTDYQHAMLSSMENGEMKRSKDLLGASTYHRLVEKGILEYVQMHTGHYEDDIWRLTARGREIMGLPPVSSPKEPS